MSYAAVNLDESEHAAQSSVAGAGAAEEGVDGAEQQQVRLMVLHKEKKVTLYVRSLDSSVLELKSAISAATGVVPERQRLLFSGRLLKPDTLTLTSFKVTPGAILHLFPSLAPPQVSQGQSVPPTAVAFAVPQTGAIHVQGNPLHASVAAAAQTVNAGRTATTAGPEGTGPEDVVTTCSERVRVFSRLLLVLSYLSIFATCMVFLNEGRVGKTMLESTVSALDFFVSVSGVHVGRLGLAAVPMDAPPDAELIKEYCRKLSYLTLGAVVLRCLWVLDVVDQVRTDVAESKAATAAGTPRVDPLTGQEALPLSDDIVFTVGIQAVAFGLIIISIWLRCYVNSVTLRLAVCPETRAQHAQEMSNRSAEEAV